MSNAPKPVKQSHSKQRRKVNDGPLPIRAPCESLAANANVVTQPTQECRHDDDEIAAISHSACCFVIPWSPPWLFAGISFPFDGG